MMIINLDGVDAWTGGTMLLPGTHQVRITDAKEDVKNDRARVEVELTDPDGASIRDWITLSRKAAGRIRQFLEAVKFEIPEGDFEMPVAQLVGRGCEIVVREEIYGTNDDGTPKTSLKVKAYNPLGHSGSDLPVPATAGNSSGGMSSDKLPF